MSRRHLAMLLVLSAIWGSSFLFIKVAVRELEPSVLLLARFVFAAAALALVVGLRTRARDAVATLRGSALPLVVVGLVNSAVPFWLLFWAQQRIDSALAAIIQASAPLFSALLAFLFVRAERVSGLRLLGIVIGFGGVVLLVGRIPGGETLAGLAVVGTALCYAAGGLYARRLTGVPPPLIALGTMIAGLVVSLPFGIAQLPDSVPGWKASVSAVVLGVLCTAAAYLLYFAIIAGAGATRAILVTYLVPSFALFYGVVFLAEPLTAAAIGGLVLILGGVALGTGAARIARRRAVPEVPV